MRMGVLRVALSVAVASLLFAVAVRRMTLPPLPSARILATALATVVVLFSASWAFRCLRFVRIARGAGATGSAWRLSRLHLQAGALNLALPAKAGEAAQIAFLAQRGASWGEAAGATVAIRVLDLGAVLAIGAVALALAGADRPPWAVAPVAAATLALVLGLALVAWGGASPPARWIDARLPRRFLDRRLTIAALFDAILRTLRGAHVAPVLALTALAWTLEFASAAVVAALLGLPVPLALVAVSLAALAAALPLTPGGLGVYEVVFAEVVAAAGSDGAVALVAATLDHATKALLALVAGGLASLAEPFSRDGRA